VAQSADGEYAIHQFKNYVAQNSAGLTWKGQSNVGCTVATVYLQIYNRDSTTWEPVDSDNASDPDIDFELSAEVADLTNYKDGSNIISCRVYQQGL